MKTEFRKESRRLDLSVGAGSDMPYIAASIFDRGLNGYLNYCRYEVTGHDGSAPKGIRTLHIDAISEAAAQAAAVGSGLGEPFEITAKPHTSPSAVQREYAHDLGITLPEDVCGEDAACLIARAVEDDSEVPSTGLALYADRHGAKFSAWTGKRAFWNLLWQTLGAHDRLCLFVYCVECYLNSSVVSDPDDHDIAGYARFADEYIENAEVMRVIERSEGEELLGLDAYAAKTNTAAFTAAVGFLRGYRLS